MSDYVFFKTAVLIFKTQLILKYRTGSTHQDGDRVTQFMSDYVQYTAVLIQQK